VRYDGGTYNPDRVKLVPHQTIAIDLRELRDNQKKDVRGGVGGRSSGKVRVLHSGRPRYRHVDM